MTPGDVWEHLPFQTLNDDLKAGQEEEVALHRGGRRWEAPRVWCRKRSLSVRDSKGIVAVELGPKNWRSGAPQLLKALHQWRGGIGSRALVGGCMR